jgi:hypothetical protein
MKCMREKVIAMKIALSRKSWKSSNRTWLNKLRQESQEEDGQFWVWNIEQEGLYDQANSGNCRWRVNQPMIFYSL